jgi:hypothetical protein
LFCYLLLRSSFLSPSFFLSSLCDIGTVRY